MPYIIEKEGSYVVEQPTESEQPSYLGELVSNIPSSAANFAGDIYSAVTSPLQTASNLKDVIQGGMQNLLPEMLQPSVTADQRAKASALGQFYKERYGGGQNIAETVKTDPVGALADLSAIFGLGAGAAVKAPAVSKALSTASKVTDPIMATYGLTKGVGEVAKQVAGSTTQAGPAAISAAYEAGRAGKEQGKAFTANMRGQVPSSDIVIAARDAVSEIRKSRGDQYRSGMVDITGDKTVLDFEPIDAAFASQKEKSQYGGLIKDPSAEGARQNIGIALDEWRNGDPSIMRTPEGLDALKQRIGDIRDSYDFGSRSRTVADEVYNSIKKVISQQAPKYAEVMADYEKASTALSELQKSLSLGEKASSDTALRKLQSIMRNNANTNYGERVRMGEMLASKDSTIMPALAGQMLNSYQSRGLGPLMAMTGGAGLYGAVGPIGLPIAAYMQSPRLLGETANALGMASRVVPPARPLTISSLLGRESEK